MHLCQKTVMTTKAAEKKVVTTKAPKPVVERGHTYDDCKCRQFDYFLESKMEKPLVIDYILFSGSFAQPNCCSAPWTFNGATGQCILDMEAQGVKDKDMDPLCTAVGFELQEKTCIRYVRLCKLHFFISIGKSLI
ncbi:unnamed protein product [Onchocerca flexuosa]|uniref:PAN domain protein n=1 Tax=Onchocerca flexuosa TaxID=387005 RepID=A0A183HXE4_9BILA|nr:unnamed protein product [Onchocerca flexuosa]